MRADYRRLATILLAACLAACGDRPPPQAGPAPPPAGPAATTTPAPAAPDLPGSPLGLSGDELTRQPWTGDFDGMVERRRIRILAPYSRTFYFVDKGVPYGIAQDIAVLLETTLNKQLKTGNANRLFVTVVPTSRDALYDALVQGRGDLIVAGITVTPGREKLVDFTLPTKTSVRQIVVTGPGAPAIGTVADLAGKEVAVREGSIQFETLDRLNAAFRAEGRPPVRIRTVPPLLEDEDLLEMANAGLLRVVVVDEAYAAFWQQILPDIRPRTDLVLRDEGALAWAARKGSPKLMAVLNPIVKANAEGTLFGNLLLRKYLKDTKLVRNATADEQLGKFDGLVARFRKYADKYSMDYLLMMAQGYQESQLDQSVRSHVGAIGVMQVMPATARELNVGDVTRVDPNIEAGVKYMRFMIDQYYKDEPMDNLNKVLFAFASYNAGPNRIRSLRREAAARNLDPNVWFNNVERVVAEKIGRETVTYVSNIYKYYVAYTLVMQEKAEREAAREAAGAA